MCPSVLHARNARTPPCCAPVVMRVLLCCTLAASTLRLSAWWWDGKTESSASCTGRHALLNSFLSSVCFESWVNGFCMAWRCVPCPCCALLKRTTAFYVFWCSQNLWEIAAQCRKGKELQMCWDGFITHQLFKDTQRFFPMNRFFLKVSVFIVLYGLRFYSFS
jgi:hypothetical protein